MTDQELMDAMDGLFAYDAGCVDSGIHDPVLRARVKQEIRQGLRPHSLFTDRLARLARDMWLSDEAIEQGYGLETIRSFVNWLDDEMR